MVNDLKVFSSTEFGELGVMLIDGKEYFPATQCAKILGYADPYKALKQHCKGDGWAIRPVVVKTTNQHGVTTEQMVDKKFINEGNLYRLIVSSKLPAAEKFERWVFDEVLPSIRRTGGYGSQNVEELIAKTAAAVVTEVFRQLMPIMTAPQGTTVNVAVSSDNSKAGKKVKRFKYRTPSKMDTISPELRAEVDDMICSGKYSCQQIANYIENKSDMKISATAVNHYAHRNFWD